MAGWRGRPFEAWPGRGGRGLGGGCRVRGAGGEDGVYIGQVDGGRVKPGENGVGVLGGEQRGEIGADCFDALEIGLGEEVAVADQEEVSLGEAAEDGSGVCEVGAAAGGVLVVGAAR